SLRARLPLAGFRGTALQSRWCFINSRPVEKLSLKESAADSPAVSSRYLTRSAMRTITRRELLAGIVALPLTGLNAAQPARRLRVAAIYTVFTHRSHAHVIL